MQNLHTLPSLKKYQTIAVQDRRALWHRAIILGMIEKGTFLFISLFIFVKDVASDLSNVNVYFFDIGHIERISINNIRELLTQFQNKPAVAIPCCLYDVCPINSNERLIWKLDDKVHDEFIKLMVNIVNYKVCSMQDQCHNVEMDIPSK